MRKNSSFHSKSKHIDLRYHWIRDLLEEKRTRIEKIRTNENGSYMMTRDVLEEKQTHIEKIHTNDNGSDMMTKYLSREKLQVFKQKENLVEKQK